LSDHAVPTRLGLLSDTHGDSTATAAAVRLFVEAKVISLIHLGDVGTDAVLEELVAFTGGTGGTGDDGGEGDRPSRDVHLVFGNCDNASSLGRHAERLGLRVHHPAGLIEIGGRRIGFTHGHLFDLADRRVVDRFLDRLNDRPCDGRLDVLLHGHTHRRRDERVDRMEPSKGSTRIINPGALHRTDRMSVAVLEVETDRLETLWVSHSPDTKAGTTTS